MSSQAVEDLKKRVITNFMDILVLTEMKKGALSGYDIIDMIQKRFGILVSPGTVYNLLYSLERNGFIKNVGSQQKRVYSLTTQGERNIKLFMKANNEIQNLIKTISITD